MKGEDKKLVRFFEGSDKRFIIPLYQRNYDWEIKHWAESTGGCENTEKFVESSNGG